MRDFFVDSYGEFKMEPRRIACYGRHLVRLTRRYWALEKNFPFLGDNAVLNRF